MQRHDRLATAIEWFNLLSLVGGLAILFSLSYDIILGGDYYRDGAYLELQLIVCIIFLIDFVLRLRESDRKGRFAVRNLLLLIVSIPWLNIMDWVGADLSRNAYIVLKSMPLVRGVYALWMLADWLTRNRARSLLYSYLFIVVAFTYFSALIFYTYENGRNPHLHGFGDAVWWAWMNVTTVGAEVFAVSAIGKVLSVMLPALGMMLFPVFTVYITDRLRRRHDGAAERNGRR